MMPNAFELIDDTGTSWQCDSVSPGAIASACRDSVRRWRLERIGAHLPGLIPIGCDVGAADCSEGTILLDLTVCTHPLICGKGIGARKTEDWDPAWSHSLLSATVGGKCTQVPRETFYLSSTNFVSL